jgi:translation initiation factor 4G
LRQNKWVLRGNAAQVGPTTIAKIHEMAEKANEEKESAMKRGNSNRGNFIPNNNHMSRTGSHRGGGRDYQSFKSNYNNNKNSNSGGDGWNTVGNTSPGPTSKTRVSELSNFGKLDRSRSKSSTLGPSNSPFASLTKNKSFSENKESPEGRASPARNMFR